MYTFKNNLKTTLHNKLRGDATTIDCKQLVSSGDAGVRLAAWPAVGNGNFFTLTIIDQNTRAFEIVKCTEVLNNYSSFMSFAVKRGQEGTAAQDFDIDTSSVEHRLTAAGLSSMSQNTVWSEDGVPYPINAQVYYNDKWWIALRANSVEPAEGADWAEFSAAPATTTSRGIGRVATAADSLPGSTVNDGPAFLDAETVKITSTPTGNAVVKAGADGRLAVGWVPGLFVGDIRLVPFAPADLVTYCPGWFFCNGDNYALISAVGKALKALPTSFKTAWGIVITGSKISIPKLFYTNGRGFFLRAVDGTTRVVGSVQVDMFASHTHTYNSGPGNYLRDGSIAVPFFTDSQTGATGGEETRPLNVGMTPAIFLGV